jgi:periplasmic copper chaperone A
MQIAMAAGLLGVAAALLLGLGPASAENYTLKNLRINHPYARPTPPGARIGGAYFTIDKVGGGSDRLVRVETPIARAAEIHTMTMDGNVMRMRQIAALDIPAHSTAALKPGGYHLMLVDLKRPLAAGEVIPLSLTFEKAGTIEIAALVEAPGH